MEQFLTPPQIAKRLGVGREKVRQWIRSGELNAINISNNVQPRHRVAESDIASFLAGRGLEPWPRRDNGLANQQRY
jgi:excisionase family DNA binding protein